MVFAIKRVFGYFLAGIFALLPLGIAFLIVGYAITLIELSFALISNSTDPLMISLFGLTLLLLVTLIGREVRHNKAFKLISIGELWLSKFPVIGKIISVINEFIDMVRGEGKFKSLGVARVPFGGSKIYALITNESTHDNVKEYTVFIVQGTFPPTGLVCFYNEDEIEIVDNMTPSDVFQLQITLGVSEASINNSHKS